jgi:hypothetical protein
MTDPLTGITLFNAIATAAKTLDGIAQRVSKAEEKRQLMEVYDTLMDLKRQAADLEDENRNLKERLRFRSDDFEFRNPFYYEKTHPERPLCAKCYANQKIAPMGEPYRATGMWRRCLVCETAFEIEPDTEHMGGVQRRPFRHHP